MPARSQQELFLIDGALDWSEGVNSDVVPTIQSPATPNGLKRTQVAWMDNATVRGGGITQRTAWNGLGDFPVAAQFQGQFLYEPVGANPYGIIVMGGHVFRFDVDHPDQAVDLSNQFKLTIPVTERVFFCQAEEFLIIQAGDGTTLPLFWDGNVLRKSNGLTGFTDYNGHNINEIPAATSMAYYMGRVWYAQDRNYSAGDIVGNTISGTLPYQFRDSVLKVTENPLCVGGDGFAVPSQAGNIRGIAFSANINTQLGEGALYIGTREQIYTLSVPVSRADWIAADANNQPLQTVALISNGWVNDRSIVEVNGDLFFQSLEPSIRSFTTAVRNFTQWGNVPISINENRVLQFNDRSLLRFGSGIYFDNRLLQTALPFVVPCGIAHKCIIPLNFDVISTFERQLPPCWEGMWEGLNILELSTADFGGLQRAFASVWSDEKKTIQWWELSTAGRWDNNGQNRVSWYIEFPAFTWGSEYQLKKLIGAELWVDKLLGEVVFRMDYRPDGDPCWYPWMEWKECTAKDSCETVHNPVCTYPTPMRESYRQMVTLPSPPVACASVMHRPSNIGHQFQVRLTIKGWCRVRGLYLHAEPVERKLYSNLVC